MQKCKNCGAEIRYIATSSGACTICEAEKKPFVTENGRMIYGYLIHICKGSEKKEDAETRGITNNR